MNKIISTLALAASATLAMTGCNSNQHSLNTQDTLIKLITLDPGHFHSALIQKTMFPGIDPEVRIYAPEGQELDAHLKLVNSYNSREDNPTYWKEELYTKPDFFDRMIADKAGNVVVIAGNNQKKTDYILKSIKAGFNVLADKPMAIDSEGFAKLVTAFDEAQQNGAMLYDIMTERYEITSILQKELSKVNGIFGTLENGTPENPGVIKESVHHFYKNVSGAPLVRPAWFFDIRQQGEGLVDITTHMVDLIQWACFPEVKIDYKSDIKIHSARRWATPVSPSEFEQVTGKNVFPDYLHSDVKDGILQTVSNGEINYSLKGLNAKVAVTWNFRAPEGAGDTHFSMMRGTKANIIIRQGKEQDYKPVLYIEPLDKNDASFSEDLKVGIKTIQQKYQGVDIRKVASGWEVLIPEELKVGHEAHFGQVAEKYLGFLKSGKMPEWEVPNMLAKYYTTTQAREMALKALQK